MNPWFLCFRAILLAAAVISGGPDVRADNSPWMELRGSRPLESARLLEQIPSGDPEFRFATEELMKIFYEEQDWERFFAYARYYRSRWASQDWSEVYLLEPLALMRHCRTETLALVLYLKDQRPQDNALLQQIEDLAQIHFESKPVETQTAYSLRQRLRGGSLWPIRLEKIHRQHPAHLRLRVESACD